MSNSIKILGKMQPNYESQVLSQDALEFVAELHRLFNRRRCDLLGKREKRQQEIDQGKLPHFLEETSPIRSGEWRVAPTPDDLNDRRVEITGPVDRKMIINALNSGAKVFMADFEDASSPTWENMVEGQINLKLAIRRKVDFKADTGKEYKLKENTATLVVRPRGWHLLEEHLLIDGEPVSASLFDFGLYFFHNAKELVSRNSGPYFYLPKLESHLEARLWNDVFNFAQKRLGVPQGSIRVTVLIETIMAAFEMEEILYELRDHAAGLNAGRWDYIFSFIKRLGKQKSYLLPDRAQVTMGVPFMRSYSQLLVKSCHKRGAHAIGGMAAFIPNRRDPEITEKAIEAVTQDKKREAQDGFDGTWVAHPDLVPVAKKVFDVVLGDQPNQKKVLRQDVNVTEKDLLNPNIPGGKVSIEGLRTNISVALQYMDHWLGGFGAVALNNLMEDAATAEISRAQLWQWIHNQATLEDGRTVTPDLYKNLLEEEVSKLGGLEKGHLRDTVEVLDHLILEEEFGEFFTLPAYKRLDHTLTGGMQ